LPLGYYYTSGLLVEALQIALSTKRSVYDSLYLALAVKEEGQLMTDDRKLYESLQSTLLARFVTLIENY
jgi:predicted nucleic acid-binding protein